MWTSSKISIDCVSIRKGCDLYLHDVTGAPGAEILEKNIGAPKMVDFYCGFNCGRLHFWPGAPRGFSEVEKLDPLMFFSDRSFEWVHSLSFCSVGEFIVWRSFKIFTDWESIRKVWVLYLHDAKLGFLIHICIYICMYTHTSSSSSSAAASSAASPSASSSSSASPSSSPHHYRFEHIKEVVRPNTLRFSNM